MRNVDIIRIALLSNIKSAREDASRYKAMGYDNSYAYESGRLSALRGQLWSTYHLMCYGGDTIDIESKESNT